jgi:hypothetical protein
MNHRTLAMALCAFALSFMACQQQPPALTEVNDSLDDSGISVTTVNSLETVNPMIVPKSVQITGQGGLEVRFVARPGEDHLQNVEVAMVKLCGDMGCDNFSEPKVLDSTKLESPEGAIFASGAFSAMRYDHAFVFVRRPSGYTMSSIPLREPFQVFRGFLHALFFTLANPESSETDHKIRVTGSSGLSGIPAGAQHLFLMDPRRETRLKLEDGSRMEIPKKAMSKLQAFALNRDDGVDDLASYTLVPNVALQKEARFSLSVDTSKLPQGFNGRRVAKIIQSHFDLEHFEVPATTEEFPATIENHENTVMIESKLTGQIQVRNEQQVLWDGSGKRVVLNPTPPTTKLQTRATSSQACADLLSANLVSLKATLDATGSVKTDLCLGISPYVNIVLVNMRNPLYQTQIARKFKFLSNPDQNLPGAGGAFPLDSVLNLTVANSAFVGINGATFRGGFCNCAKEPPHAGQDEFKGTSSLITPLFEIDPYGLPATTVIAQGSKVTEVGGYSRIKGNESVLAFYKNVSGSGIRANQVPGTLGVTFQTSDAGGAYFTAVGSTTSIIKNGVCNLTQGALGAVFNTSAIGFGNDRLVLVSSDHNREIDPWLTCGIFEGLNALGGAILLDGGAAAQLVYAGTLLNLTTFQQSLLFGAAQKIAYSIVVDKTAR